MNKNQNKTSMTKAMGPFRDSQTPSWLSGPGPMYRRKPPLIGSVPHNVSTWV